LTACTHPIVEDGEREIDVKTGTVKLQDGSRETPSSLGVDLGVTG